MARARRRAYALALTLAAAAVTVAPARAQHLQPLHVTAVGLHADRTTVKPGEAFHVTVRVHVAERGVAIAPILILPTLDNLDDLGDERHAVAVPQGTEFVEVLTLAARAPGEASLSPAYLDAIDARTGKPSRFSSQSLRIRVTGGSAAGDAVTGSIGAALRTLAWIAGIVVALIVALVLVVLVLRRRAPPLSRPEISAGYERPPAGPAPPPDPHGPVRAALAALRRDPSEARRIELRRELFALVGAPAGATLTDVLSREPTGALRGAVLAAEHAAFCRPADRADADARFIAATENLLDAGRERAWTS